MIEKGSKIGIYEVISELGAGGMGKVYLAEDTKLLRKVAIKILNETHSQDDEINRRFRLEALAASALNHPNIVTIYLSDDLNETQHFIVMEFVEGNNLRTIINKKELKFENLLDIAIQTTSALAEAHGAGIVHRDIKPENIMLRSDGLVKVLDFGLAKQKMIPIDSGTVDPDAKTQAYQITSPGIIMGTAAYMSPEQARGKTTDERTDIWSFGVVLFEMVTGHAPFTGETKSDVMAAVLIKEPEPVELFAPDIPAEFSTVIKKTLIKEITQRYQTANELLIDLKKIQADLNFSQRSMSVGLTSSGGIGLKQRQTELLTKPPFVQAKNLWRWIPIPLILLIIGTFSYLYFKQSQTTEQINISALSSSQIMSWKSDLGESVSGRARFSPDSKFIAFVSVRNDKRNIWIKQIGGGDPFTQHDENDNNRSPVWSPDSQKLAFVSEHTGRKGIWTAPAMGGSPVFLTPLETNAELIMWSKDDKILYFEYQQNLHSFEFETKETTKLTNFPMDGKIKRTFDVSPNEKEIVYVDRTGGQADLWIADIHGNDPKHLTNDVDEESNPVWHPDGKRIIYNLDRKGLRQVFLAATDGQPNTQLTFNNTNNSLADVSADGTKILYQSTRDESDLWAKRLDGDRETQLTSDIGSEFWQDVAPQNDKIVYQALKDESVGTNMLNCLIIAQNIGTEKKRIELSQNGFNPQWSPDGSQIAYLKSTNGENNIWLTKGSTGDSVELTKKGIFYAGFSVLPFNHLQTKDFQWSPDSNSLIFVSNRDNVSNIWEISTDGTVEKQLTDNKNGNLLFYSPILSPDGEYMAWVSAVLKDKKIGDWEIWVAKKGQIRQLYKSKFLITLLGWSVSGNELIFNTAEKEGDSHFAPIDINVFQLKLDDSNPRLLFSSQQVYFHNIQLSPDRKTIAFAQRKDGNSVIQIMPTTGGKEKMLVNNNDARIYFSGISFAPDSKTLYYGKQANWQIITMIENFK